MKSNPLATVIPVLYLLFWTAPSAIAQDGTIAPTHLRCEYLTNPLGIDAQRPRLSWTLEATNESARARVQTAYQILVAPNPESLAADHGDLWDSGIVKSDRTTQVEFDGPPLSGRTRAYWKVRVWDNEGHASDWSAPSTWSTGLLWDGDWGDAEWIGEVAPASTDPKPPAPPPTMLRRPFRAGGGPAHLTHATLYATALGLYQLRLNGQRIGDAVLAPEWTDYHKRIQYQTYDVTPLIRDGQPNVLAAILGDGWYAGRIGLSFIVKDGPSRNIYGPATALKARLDLEFADGSLQTFVTGDGWQCSTEGPLRSADMLDGVTYDAQREMLGWDTPDFKPTTAQAWHPVQVREPVAAALVAQPNEPVRLTHTLDPISVSEPKPSIYVFDLGQNMVGWCRLSLPAGSVEPGQTITLRHAEVLNPDGTIFTANLRSAAATDRYIARGQGPEVFEPCFTYHGFRYVEVTGLKSMPQPDLIAGRAINSNPDEVGSFDCSDPMLTKLMQNILWTQRGNMQSVPTDCPQRDERLGWMGDILAFAQTACFNMDMAAFFTKWVPDVRDAQADDGRFADFSPHPYDSNTRFSGVPAWGDAGVTVPWCAYQNYGDTRILENHYAAAKRWVDCIHSKNPDLLWKNSRGNDYGDWLTSDTFHNDAFPKTGADTPHDIFGTIFFFHSADLLSKMAAVLGNNADASTYSALAADIKVAFHKAYVHPDGAIEGNTQGSYALALQFGLIDADQRATAAKHMVEGFAPYKGSLSTGFHSTGPLMQQLVENGYESDAFRLLTARTMPGWLYPIEHGATTTWERWDGYTEGRGFQDSGMNSFSHYAFGAVGEWMYRNVIGLNLDSPGWTEFSVHPRLGGILPVGGGVTWASGSYGSIRGRIACNWKYANKRFTAEITVPPNTTATVYIPSTYPPSITESGKPLTNSNGIKSFRLGPIAGVVSIGSGTYSFASELALVVE